MAATYETGEADSLVSFISCSEYDKDQKSGKKVSAFLGPDLWDETYDNTDISLEYNDLEEFLKENGIPNNPDNVNAANLNKFQSPNRQVISSGHNLQACDSPQDTLARNSQQPINSAPDTLPSMRQQAINSAQDTFPSGNCMAATYETGEADSLVSLISCSEYDKGQKSGKKVSAFLGPDLWDETYDNTDISLEYNDLEEFLKENGIPNNPDNVNAANLNKFQSPNRQVISSGHNLQACDSPQDTLARNSQQPINSAPDTLPSMSQQAINSAQDTFPSKSKQAISSAPDTCPNDSPQTTPSPQNMFPNGIPQTTPSPQNMFPNDSRQTTPSPQNMFPNDIPQATPSPQNMFPNDSPQATPPPQNMFPNDIPQATSSPQNTFPNDSRQTTPSPQNMFPNDSRQATPSPQNVFPNDSRQTTPSPQNMFPNDIPQTTPSPQNTFPKDIPQITPSPQNMFPNDSPQATPPPPNMFPNDIPQTTPSPQNMFPNDISQTTPSPQNMFPNDSTQATSMSPITFPRQLPPHQSQLAVSQYDTMPSPPTSALTESKLGESKATESSYTGGPEPKVDFDLSPPDLALVSIPGLKDFDPRKRTFSEEELKPQPMFKKSRKIFVPDDNKDDRYWCRRKKNNVAAKRSRDARRIKENQIAMRAAFLEKENSVLRTELEQIKRENADILISLTEFETMEP
ncbi:rhoGEF domain-containing protein gxcI-like isoform X1 [Haliotis rufescens]|uniref:rhoGEF domain-containing protein gxcI-like isoform X1 n=1 Tax=Haliotis rufescens TaxID=6454 RepID=UPI00201EB91A|nr:rhoGEF domain-containing protein gxcI-like isoform X1 [Haliotis rufescens]